MKCVRVRVRNRRLSLATVLIAEAHSVCVLDVQAPPNLLAPPILSSLHPSPFPTPPCPSGFPQCQHPPAPAPVCCGKHEAASADQGAGGGRVLRLVSRQETNGAVMQVIDCHYLGCVQRTEGVCGCMCVYTIGLPTYTTPDQCPGSLATDIM